MYIKHREMKAQKEIIYYVGRRYYPLKQKTYYAYIWESDLGKDDAEQLYDTKLAKIQTVGKGGEAVRTDGGIGERANMFTHQLPTEHENLLGVWLVKDETVSQHIANVKAAKKVSKSPIDDLVEEIMPIYRELNDLERDQFFIRLKSKCFRKWMQEQTKKASKS